MVFVEEEGFCVFGVWVVGFREDGDRGFIENGGESFFGVGFGIEGFFFGFFGFGDWWNCGGWRSSSSWRSGSGGGWWWWFWFFYWRCYCWFFFFDNVLNDRFGCFSCVFDIDDFVWCIWFEDFFVCVIFCGLFCNF